MARKITQRRPEPGAQRRVTDRLTPDSRQRKTDCRPEIVVEGPPPPSGTRFHVRYMPNASRQRRATAPTSGDEPRRPRPPRHTRRPAPDDVERPDKALVLDRKS